jgi:hypothetical protein
MEFTPTGGSTYRISTEDRALTYQWFGYVQAFNSLKIALPTRHGGIAQPEFSDIIISPDLIAEIGSIPQTAAVTIKETDSDEAAAVTIFDGTALLGDYDRNGFGYILYRPANEEKTTKTTSYNNTLTTIATSLCTTMGLTIDTTYARDPSPAVLHTAEKDQLLFDLLSDMLAFFSHGAVVVGSTLYLYDMLGTYTATDPDEFDFQPARYRKDTGYSLFSNGDAVSIAGSFENGGEYDVKQFHTTTANIQTALGDIKTILEQDIAIVPFKQDATKPGILQKISLTDNSTVLSVSFSGIVTSVIYNYETLGVEVEASGAVTV